MADLYYGGQFHPLRDPEVAGRRLPIATPGYTYITFAASRTEVRPIFLDGWPVQADYQAAWIIFQARKAWESDNAAERSEEHTSELQSLMRISYAVFCLKKKKLKIKRRQHNNS